jgi:hypothetical protein
MAKPPGLFQRNGVLQFRGVVPKHLQDALGGRTKMVHSLNSRDRREAAVLGATQRAVLSSQLNAGPNDGNPFIQPSRLALVAQAPSPLRTGYEATRSLPESPGSLLTAHLGDVFERWKLSKPRSADSIEACGRAIGLDEQFTGNPPISRLTRDQGDRFRAWLKHRDQGTTSKMARDHLPVRCRTDAWMGTRVKTSSSSTTERSPK